MTKNIQKNFIKLIGASALMFVFMVQGASASEINSWYRSMVESYFGPITDEVAAQIQYSYTACGNGVSKANWWWPCVSEPNNCGETANGFGQIEIVYNSRTSYHGGAEKCGAAIPSSDKCTFCINGATDAPTCKACQNGLTYYNRKCVQGCTTTDPCNASTTISGYLENGQCIPINPATNNDYPGCNTTNVCGKTARGYQCPSGCVVNSNGNNINASCITTFNVTSQSVNPNGSVEFSWKIADLPIALAVKTGRTHKLKNLYTKIQ
jgi:hypothetical protein